MLLGGAGDLGVHVVDHRHRLSDGFQRLGRFGGVLHAFVRSVLTVFHDPHHIPRALLQLLNHGLDFFGGLLGLLRQVAHFIGHYGEAATLLTGPGGFDGGVECQQVGLLGDPADGGEDGVDVFTVLRQGLHHADRATDFHGQNADGVRSITDNLHPLTGSLIRMAGGLRGLRRVTGDVLGGGGHFLHGGGDLIDLGHLFVHTRVGADGDVGGVFRRVADALHRCHHLSDHCL
ncbi:hypothetical protein D3C86_1485240 [compost metagenome]